MGAYMIICLRCPVSAIRLKFQSIENKLLSFCDSGVRANDFELTFADCLTAVQMALQKRWYSFATFDVNNYNWMADVLEGDMSWALPGQILAMSSPTAYDIDDGLKPSQYIQFFKKHRVSTVVRLNEQMY